MAPTCIIGCQVSGRGAVHGVLNVQSVVEIQIQ